MSFIIEVDFYNSYIIQKVDKVDFNGGNAVASWPGPWYPQSLSFNPVGGNSVANNWYIEESRIRGGFNNTSTDLGVRAYLDEEDPLQQNRISTLIYSGVYNSRTGINQTNVFSIGDAITKSLNPIHGSIQKTYAEDTNLVVFQENKIHRALIDKDTIYTTESGTQTQAGAVVIGQFVPYKGEYGISKNPESFAIYNYRKYFSDKSRNSIMRLSNDGLTEISMYGMRDYFRDRLAEIDNNFVNRTFTATVVSGGGTSTTVAEVQVDGNDSITPGMTIQGQSGGYVTLVEDAGGGNTRIYYSQLFSPSLIVNINFLYKTRGRIIGGWDTHNKNYVLSMQKYPIQVNSSETPDPNTGEYDSYKTLAFDEDINGWFSFFTFKPTIMFSVLNKFYSVENSSLYEHYDNTTANNRGNFYGTQSPSNITFVFNAQPNIVKNFKTINYEGSNGWEVTNFKSGFEGMDPNPATPPTPAYIQNQDKNYVDPSTLIAIRSYEEGAYDGAGNTGSAASATNPPLLRAGFNRKENKYVANLISGSAARAGEVRFGNQMTGVKGYFATVTIETDNTTQLGGPKELWSAGTEYVISSY